MSEGSRILTGDQLARMVCDAMGIECKGIAQIVIWCQPQKAARIEITKYATDDVGDRLRRTLRTYLLVEPASPGGTA